MVILALFLLAYILLRHTYILSPSSYIHQTTPEEIELFLAQGREMSTVQNVLFCLAIFLVPMIELAAVVVNVNGIYNLFFSKKRVFHLARREKVKLLLLVASLQIVGILFTRYCVDRYAFYMELISGAMLAVSFFLCMRFWGKPEPGEE